MDNKIITPWYKKTIFGFLMLSVFFLLSTTSSLAASYVSLKIYPEQVGVFVTTGTQQFVAFGVTATGASVNITDQVNWESSNESLVKIDPNGLAVIQPLITAGQVKITCSYPKTGVSVAGPTHLLLKPARR